MEAAKIELYQAKGADIVVQDRDGQAVLLVEVKGTKLKNQKSKEISVSQLKSYLQNGNNHIPFVMLVDLEDIDIFQGDDSNLSKPVSSLKTATVLNHYDSEFSSKRIFVPYLETLVEAWLRDLAYHWKSNTPPASEQLAAIGLLQSLEGGTTQADVELSCDSLR